MMKRITLTLASPYVGLRPFSEQEALLFFGRDAHVRELLARLERQQRFVAVLGASGTGKSSLVRAGLIPALHRGALHTTTAPDADTGQTGLLRWSVHTFTPGEAPLARLSETLASDPRWLDDPQQVPASTSALATRLATSPLALAELMQARAEQFSGDAVLLVVDQFEEIFRYRQRDPNEAEAFVRLLLRCANEPGVPLHVVLTMRSDFLGNAVTFHGLPEAINTGIYLTPRLAAEQIRSVITAPLKLVGGEIDPVLANRLVNTLGGEDELPVLEHALLRMWDRARAEGRSRVTDDDYAAICTRRDRIEHRMADAPVEPTEANVDPAATIAPDEALTSSTEPPAAAHAATPVLVAISLSYAIDNHANEIFDALSAAQQAVARELFVALVERRDGRDVRRPQTLRQLVELVGVARRNEVLAVVDAYRRTGVGFVLPAEKTALEDGSLVDISHESLIRRWQPLQRWLADEELDASELQDWLRRAQRQQRSGGGLLDERDHQRAQQWRLRLARHPDVTRWSQRYCADGDFAAIDAFVSFSGQRHAREKSEREALARAADEARLREAQAQADLQRVAAESAQAAQAQAEREKRQAEHSAAINRKRSRIALLAATVAVLFGLAALWSWQQASRALNQAQTLTRIAQAGELASTAELLAKDKPDQSLLLAMEARKIDPASARANGLLRAADASYPYRLVFRGHERAVMSAKFSPDGNLVLTASLDNTARLWEVASGKELRVLRGHEAPVRSAQFSPDGATVLTASDDNTVRLWNIASGKELRALRGHEFRVGRAQFSPDGKTVLTANEDILGKDKTARLWDVVSGKELRALRGHGSSIRSSQFSPDGKLVLTASDDKTARLWDIASGKELRALRGHTDRVWSARFSYDGKLVLTASFDKTARLWDVASGKELRVLRGHDGSVRSAQFSPDGKMALTASFDKTARLWNLASGKMLQVLRGQEGSVSGAQFSPDGNSVLTAASDNLFMNYTSVHLWDVASGRELPALRGHENSVSSAQFSPDGKSVLTASLDNTARLWDMPSGKELRALRGHTDRVTSARFSPDGKSVLTSSEDTSARLWDVASGKELRALRGHKDTVRSTQFSPDGKTVLTASVDKTARLWDVASGKELRALRGHEGSVRSAQFSPDGKSVLTASDDNTARLWDVASGKELRALRGHEGPVWSAQFSLDGKTVLTSSFDGTARLWVVASGKEQLVLRGRGFSVVNAQFSPGGKSVLIANDDNVVRLLDVTSGTELGALRGHEGSVNSSHFSPDGMTVLTASDDKTARLWDVASGKELRALHGHEDSVLSAQFSPDGKTVVTASWDDTVRLWDAVSGKELRVLRGHSGRVTSAEFSPDGKTVLTASDDSTSRLWECPECRPIEEIALAVARRVGRELTDAERAQFGLEARLGAGR
ncbi:MAG: hypothetical protein RIQ60_293 [Pseudomonadota bacterium]|jgi:WD40 repeat protein